MKTTLQIVLESLMIAISIGLFAFVICLIGSKAYGIYRKIRITLKCKVKKIQYKKRALKFKWYVLRLLRHVILFIDNITSKKSTPNYIKTLKK